MYQGVISGETIELMPKWRFYIKVTGKTPLLYGIYINAAVIFQNGFSPMHKYDVSTSTYLYHYPITTKLVRWKFENDYDRIVRYKEAQFRTFTRTTLSSRYPDINCAGFEITKGSILV